MKPKFTIWFIVLLTILGLWVVTPNVPISYKLFNKKINFNLGQKIDLTIFGQRLQADFPLKLGLDLQGGTELVLETVMDKINPADRDDALESARQVIENRVNLFGVSESVVQSSTVGNQRRILVELPGLKDASAAAKLVGTTAQLDFREMPASLSAEATMSGIPAIYYSKPTGLTGADLKKAQVVFNSTGTQAGSPQVSIEFNDAGAKKFADITARNIGKPLAIFLDDQPISAPTVQQEIIGGTAVITGQFTTDQAKSLAVQLNAGALPVPIKIIDQTSIGATLGSESVSQSVVAGVIGLMIVMVYMIIYYGWMGLIADIGLLIYTTLIMAIFKTGLLIFPPVTLTLAGIAGFILSIGMAVDANILIFERMKEELRWGKNRTKALELGFDRAWSSIWASNVSSLITGGILYMFGTSIVRGFAVTLAIGVLVSMFTAVVVTKTFLRMFIK